jgi:hypothetical protein
VIDLAALSIIIWVGCFAVVSIDSAQRGTGSWFWRAASLFGGPFALVAYGIAREMSARK